MKVVLPILFVSLLPAFVVAEYIHPGDVELKTARYDVDRVNFEPGEYEYAIRWQGLPVATAFIAVAKSSDAPNRGNVNIQVKTASGIDLFYKLRHESQSDFQITPFKPVLYTMKQKENSKERNREVEFLPDGSIRAKQWKPDAEPERADFRSDNLTLDPVSAAFLARSVPVTKGAETEFDVFNGKHRFLITLKVGELENVKVSGKSVKALRVTPQVKRLTDSKPETRLQSAALWVSDDEHRDILKLESKVWIGTVSATLIRKSVPSAPPAPGGVTSARLLLEKARQRLVSPE